MSQASSFTPIEAAAAGSGPRAAALGALEGAAFTIPISLGSVTLVFSRIGGEALSAAVLATLLSIAWMQLATVRSSRPVLYSARFFEASTLAAILDQLVRRLPEWSLADTQGVRMALLALVVAGAGVWVGILYLVRADRFSRFIPAPVFAGFSNSIALVIIMTQADSLAAMLANGTPVAIFTIATAALATGFAIRKWAPRWPAAASALVLGLLLGLAWLAAGTPVPMLDADAFKLVLPIELADFTALRSPDVALGALAPVLVGHAALLGTMVFINTTLACEMLSQADGRRHASRLGQAWSAACLTVAGAMGSAPLSGTVQSSSAATRNARIGPWLLLLTAVILACVALSGLPAWIPVAAVAGALLAEAWFMVDRASLINLMRWARREPVGAHAREDIALIAAVTAVAVMLNMIAAVFAGLMLGLLLFAVRNARRPVRRVWTGLEVSSNCARARGDVRRLAAAGEQLRVIEFERDLFFGAVGGLERVLHEQLLDAQCVVLDWLPVRNLDSSAAQAIGKFHKAAAAQGVAVFHVEPARGSEVEAALAQYVPRRLGSADLDHALELAENHLLSRQPSPRDATTTTTLMETLSLMHGLHEGQRQRLEAAMEQRTVPRGQPLVRAGEASTELLLVLQGSASVVLPRPDGDPVRVAGVRRGATVGEMGFLDGSPRSATVVADEETLVAVLTRESFERLGQEDPALARQVVANIAIDLATRLRHSNRLASARHRRA